MSEEQKIENVAEYLKEVSKIKEKWSDSVLAFRGQKNEGWPLVSSAERRLKASSRDEDRVPKWLFIDYHRDLLNKCKLKNYHQREGKPLDELELLADLQHHGAATCLLDFTRNALVALWVACEKSDANGKCERSSVDGKVFVVDTDDQTAFLEITSKDIENRSISDILEFKTRETGKDRAEEPSAPFRNKPNLWYWTPAHLNERIPAQHSLFLFSLPSSMELQLKPEEIVIESASKEQIRRELKELHDIHEESLFPDFVGFAYTQRHDALYDTPSAKEYRSRGTKAAQRGQYKEAIEDFTKAIELDSNYPGTYYFRGLAYGCQGKHKQAIEDFTKAIELDSNYPDAHYFRGIAYLHLKEWEKAKEDLTAARDMGWGLTEDSECIVSLEQAIGVTLPEEIAEMLTLRVWRRQRR